MDIPEDLRFQDLTGETFGWLTVLGYAGHNNSGSVWLCQCACGRIKEVSVARVKQGWRTCNGPRCPLLLEKLFEGKFIIRPSGCHEWQGAINAAGYGQVKRDGKMLMVHRLMYEMRVGPIPDWAFVLHYCDNRRCANPEHLFLGTHQDNMDDMVAKGRQARGERHGRYRGKRCEGGGLHGPERQPGPA